MLESEIAEHMNKHGFTWTVDGEQHEVTESDVTRVLDRAAARLYDGSIGDQLEVGGLIIRRESKGFTIYVRFGDYL